MSTEDKKTAYRLLMLIISQKFEKKALELFSQANTPINYCTYAKGTASGDFVDMIGLGGVHKTVMISILPKDFCNKFISRLENKLYLGTPNTGVAFSVKLSGGSGAIVPLMQTIKSQNNTSSSKAGETMDNKNNYTLIMAFVNQGFSEDVMTAARHNGAGGGTVFHSRRLDNDAALKLWGIQIQPEREIVMILASNSSAPNIMKAISQNCGVQSEARGIVISMPVDNVVGLGNKDSENEE